MSRHTRNFWTGGIVLGCAVFALCATSAPGPLTGIAEANPGSASVATDDAARFIMNPFLQASNPQQKLLKDWLDMHQRMSSPVKYSTSNSPLRGDPRVKGC